MIWNSRPSYKHIIASYFSFATTDNRFDVCIYIKQSSWRRNFGAQTLIASVDVKQHDISMTRRYIYDLTVIVKGCGQNRRQTTPTSLRRHFPLIGSLILFTPPHIDAAKSRISRKVDTKIYLRFYDANAVTLWRHLLRSVTGENIQHDSAEPVDSTKFPDGDLHPRRVIGVKRDRKSLENNPVIFLENKNNLTFKTNNGIEWLYSIGILHVQTATNPVKIPRVAFVTESFSHATFPMSLQAHSCKM